MPIKENLTSLISRMLFYSQSISGDATITTSDKVDSVLYNNGVGFGLMVMNNYGSTTKVTMQLCHADDSSLSDEEVIPYNMLVYGRKTGEMPWIQGKMLPHTDSDKLCLEGVFSTKRYIHPKLIISDYDSPTPLTVIILSFLWADLLPTSQQIGRDYI